MFTGGPCTRRRRWLSDMVHGLLRMLFCAQISRGALSLSAHCMLCLSIFDIIQLLVTLENCFFSIRFFKIGSYMFDTALGH